MNRAIANTNSKKKQSKFFPSQHLYVAAIVTNLVVLGGCLSLFSTNSIAADTTQETDLRTPTCQQWANYFDLSNGNDGVQWKKDGFNKQFFGKNVLEFSDLDFSVLAQSIQNCASQHNSHNFSFSAERLINFRKYTMEVLQHYRQLQSIQTTAEQLLGELTQLEPSPASVTRLDQIAENLAALERVARTNKSNLSYLSSQPDAPELQKLRLVIDEKRVEIRRAEGQRKDKEYKERNANIQKFLQKHQAKIVALNLGAEFLKARPIINIAGVETPYRPFNEWVALLLENPSIEEIAPISLLRGRSKGIRIKLKGQPSIGILFSQEGKDLFLTHTTDRENASPVRTLSEKMQVTNFIMKLAGDPMPNHF